MFEYGATLSLFQQAPTGRDITLPQPLKGLEP